ncbi:MAG: YbiU family protein [Arthrobacter sp.]
MPAFPRTSDVEPGDSVWWHSDLIHSVEPVEPVEHQKGWGT